MWSLNRINSSYPLYCVISCNLFISSPIVFLYPAKQLFLSQFLHTEIIKLGIICFQPYEFSKLVRWQPTGQNRQPVLCSPVHLNGPHNGKNPIWPGTCPTSTTSPYGSAISNCFSTVYRSTSCALQNPIGLLSGLSLSKLLQPVRRYASLRLADSSAISAKMGCRPVCFSYSDIRISDSYSGSHFVYPCRYSDFFPFRSNPCNLLRAHSFPCHAYQS